MASYPIWNEVTACIYKSGKSYGARDTSDCSVKVGTSKRNSELLVHHVTTRRELDGFAIFSFGVDIGEGLKVIKQKWMNLKTHEWHNNMPEALRSSHV